LITHDELAAAITSHYPDLIHGIDFWVGQEVDGPAQVAPARIYQWGIPEKYVHEVRPEQHVPEQVIHAVIDEDNPENNLPEQIIPAHTVPAVIEIRTRFISKYPEPTEAELAQWVADNAAVYHAPKVPQVVTRFQARGAMLLTPSANGFDNMLAEVESIIADPATDAMARLAWADAQEFKRNSPTILAFAAQLELTDEDLDELFILAATIDA